MLWIQLKSNVHNTILLALKLILVAFRHDVGISRWVFMFSLDLDLDGNGIALEKKNDMPTINNCWSFVEIASKYLVERMKIMTCTSESQTENHAVAKRSAVFGASQTDKMDRPNLCLLRKHIECHSSLHVLNIHGKKEIHNWMSNSANSRHFLCNLIRRVRIFDHAIECARVSVCFDSKQLE